MFLILGLLGFNFDSFVLCWVILASCRSLLGSSWVPLGPPWGQLGPSWRLLGTILGASWASLGPSWALMGLLGAILGPSAPMGEPPWAALGLPWHSHGPPWGYLGPTFAHLGPTWSLEELSESLLGAFLLHFGPISVHLGVILGHPLLHWANIRVLLRCLDLPFYLSFSCLPIPKKTPSLEGSDPREASAGTRSAYNFRGTRNFMRTIIK